MDLERVVIMHRVYASKEFGCYALMLACLWKCVGLSCKVVVYANACISDECRHQAVAWKVARLVGALEHRGLCLRQAQDGCAWNPPSLDKPR